MKILTFALIATLTFSAGLSRASAQDAESSSSRSSRIQDSGAVVNRTGPHAAAAIKLLQKQGLMPVSQSGDITVFEASSLICQPDGRRVSCMVLESREGLTLTLSFTNGDSKKLYKELIELGATPSDAKVIALRNVTGQLTTAGDADATVTFTNSLSL